MCESVKTMLPRYKFRKCIITNWEKNYSITPESLIKIAFPWISKISSDPKL